GEVSDLARIHHDNRKFSTDQGASHRTLHSTRSFQHDQSRPVFAQPFDQSLDPGSVVTHRLGLTRGTYRYIETRFGHIDTDKNRAHFQNSILLDDVSFLQHSSTLRRMRALPTQATVRAFGEAERDDPCCCTICSDQGNVGLSRPVRNYVHTDTSN